MRSMTGYGRGDQAGDGCRLEVELKAVNRKQAEIQLSLPRELESLEGPVRDVLAGAITRGRVEARVNLTLPPGVGAARINSAVVRSYLAEMQQLSPTLTGPISPVSWDGLLRLPGVLEVPTAESQSERCWPLLEAALRGAVEQLNQMRGREGAALAADLTQRIALMQGALVRIATQAPGVLTRYRATLLQRVQAAGVPGVTADDERLLKEIVLFADRCDVAEEISRLTSHFTQFGDCVRARDAVGRKLDFLAQEMNREINTIGSKANDAAIAIEVVTLKTELERFREQAQNVE